MYDTFLAIRQQNKHLSKYSPNSTKTSTHHHLQQTHGGTFGPWIRVGHRSYGVGTDPQVVICGTVHINYLWYVLDTLWTMDHIGSGRAVDRDFADTCCHRLEIPAFNPVVGTIDRDRCQFLLPIWRVLTGHVFRCFLTRRPANRLETRWKRNITAPQVTATTLIHDCDVLM